MRQQSAAPLSATAERLNFDTLRRNTRCAFHVMHRVLISLLVLLLDTSIVVRAQCSANAGFYCPNATATPVACPKGTFCATSGLTVATNCTASFYCNTTQATAVSGLCAPGFYCAAGSIDEQGSSGAAYVTTLAGLSGSSGNTDGPASTALFIQINALVVTSTGTLVIADNQMLRALSADGSTVSTLAGGGGAALVDATGTSATVGSVSALAVDSADNIYMVSGAPHQMVKKMSPSGFVTLLAGGLGGGFVDGNGTSAKFMTPSGVAVVPDHSAILVTDLNNQRVRLVNLTSCCEVSTFAGQNMFGNDDGPVATATLHSPSGVVVDNAGNVYVSQGSQTIRKIANGQVTLFAGKSGMGNSPIDGIGTLANFATLKYGIAFDPATGTMFVPETESIRQVLISTREVSMLAGRGVSTSNGAARSVAITPTGIARDQYGVYFGDSSGRVLRMVSSRWSTRFGTRFAFPGTCMPNFYCPAGSTAPYVLRHSHALFVLTCFEKTAPRSLHEYSLILPYLLFFPVFFFVLTCLALSYCFYIYIVSIACPNGTLCAYPAMANYSIIPAGMYVPAGGTAFVACPRGAFCPTTGLSAYTSCPPSFFCNATGLTAVSGVCDAGFYCGGGAQDNQGSMGIAYTGLYAGQTAGMPTLPLLIVTLTFLTIRSKFPIPEFSNFNSQAPTPAGLRMGL